MEHTSDEDEAHVMARFNAIKWKKDECFDINAIVSSHRHTLTILSRNEET